MKINRMKKVDWTTFHPHQINLIIYFQEVVGNVRSTFLHGRYFLLIKKTNSTKFCFLF